MLKIWDCGKKLTDAEHAEVRTTTPPHAFLRHHDRVDITDGHLVELGPNHVHPPHQPLSAPAFVSRASACWGPSFAPPEAQLAEPVATNMIQNSRDTANNSGVKPVGARVPSVYLGQVPGAGAAQEGVSMFSSVDSVPVTLGIPLTVRARALSLILFHSLSLILLLFVASALLAHPHTTQTQPMHRRKGEQHAWKALFRVHR
jgi:hypothetical protein